MFAYIKKFILIILGNIDVTFKIKLQFKPIENILNAKNKSCAFGEFLNLLNMLQNEIEIDL